MPHSVCRIEKVFYPTFRQPVRQGLKKIRSRSLAEEFGGILKRPITQLMGLPKTVDRHDPKYIVEIEDENIDQFNLTKFVTSIDIHEFDDQMSVCELTVANEDGLFTDDRIFKPQNKIEVWTGYGKSRLEKRGTFYIKKPSFNFRGADSIKLKAYSEEILMHQQAKRRVFKNMKDSDIASTIASEYGFSTDIEPTDTLYPQVSQMNQTDLEFLFERAQLYGFSLKVINSTLHFHQERKRESGLRMVYKQGEDKATLKSVGFALDTALRGGGYTTTQINPVSKELLSIDSSTAPDRITEQVQSESDEPLIRAESETVLKSSVQHFLESVGHSESQSELENITQAYGEQDRWLVSGSGSCIGLELLHAGLMIEIIGVGRLSGHFLCKYVRHMFSYGKGYSVNFKVRRAWMKPTKRALQKIEKAGRSLRTTESEVMRDDITQQSEMVGTFDETLGRFI